MPPLGSGLLGSGSVPVAGNNDESHGSGGGGFPGFGGAPPAVGVGNGGAAATASRSDHTHTGVGSAAGANGITVSAATGAVTISQQGLVAQWTLGAANRRLYLVDGVNGNDANVGYLDGGSANFPISGATVAATAKKTIGALSSIFPRVGNGRHVEVIIANGGVNTEGAYVDALDTFLQGAVGFAPNCPLVRGTGTNSTAGVTAFDGTAADNDYQGGITVPGLNAGGYQIGEISTNQVLVGCIKNGGGAPAFPAEPLAPLGWRVRFASNTTTVALRNVCRVISQITTVDTANDTLTLGTTLPAVPAGADVFYVEQAGWTYPATTLQGVQAFSGGNGGGRGLQITGGRCTGNFTANGIAVNFAFAGCATLGPSGGFVNCSQTFQSMTNGSRTVGGSCHMTGNFSSVLGGCYSLLSTVTEGLIQVLEPVEFNWKVGAVCGTGMQVKGGAANDTTGVNSIGSENGQFGCRILGSNATTTAGLRLANGMFVTGAIAFTGAGARPAVLIEGGAKVQQLLTTILSGSSGNNDVGLAFAPAGGGNQSFGIYDANGNANTVTGGLGDIRINNGLAAGQIVAWAAVNITSIADVRGNRIFGSTGMGPLCVVGRFTGQLATDAVNPTANYMANPGSGVVATAMPPQNYPTSLRLISRLRATWNTGAIPTVTPVVVTLYKNGVATAMTVSIPSATAPGTTFVDSAHPIMFADGDLLDLRLDNAGGVGGTAVVSAILEGPT